MSITVERLKKNIQRTIEFNEQLVAERIRQAVEAPTEGSKELSMEMAGWAVERIHKAEAALEVISKYEF